MRQRRVGIGLALLGLLLALFAGCTQQPGQVTLSATEYDFGVIPNTKPVSEVFEVRNIGRGQLEIAGVTLGKEMLHEKEGGGAADNMILCGDFK